MNGLLSRLAPWQPALSGPLAATGFLHRQQRHEPGRRLDSSSAARCPGTEIKRQTTLMQASGHWVATGGLTNRQRIARYDSLLERAQQRADGAGSLAVRRRYLNLILRLQRRALRELDRGR